MLYKKKSNFFFNKLQLFFNIQKKNYLYKSNKLNNINLILFIIFSIINLQAKKR